MAKGFWLLLVLSVLSLVGALLLEKTLTAHYVLVLVLLLAAAVIAILAMLAVGVGSPWGWPLATLCFAGLTVLSLVMYLSTRAQPLTFMITLVLSLAGVIGGVYYVGGDDDDALGDLPKVHFEKPKARRKSGRQSKRKAR
jgi:hypothetical protein